MSWLYGTFAVVIVGIVMVKTFSKNSSWSQEETFTDKNSVVWIIKPETGTAEGTDYSFRADPLKGYEYDKSMSHVIGKTVDDVKAGIVSYAQGHMP